MDIDQTRTFLVITAHGSFLEAARQLHLSQSTVSARIRRLEDELGTRLFVRNRAGASLTPTGRRFLEHAKCLVLMAASFITTGRLHRVPESPEYVHPAYMVNPRESDSPVLEQAVEGLRELTTKERAAHQR